MNLPQAEQEFEALLYYLKHNKGCDLTSYKRSTLMRRFWYRMQSISIGSYHDYLKYLQNHSQESVTLLDTVLINVTSFFRDRNAWEYLAKDIIPEIIATSQPNEQIRVWSAGCASGQEVYSLIMLFAEALGINSCLQQVQFYATDMDRTAIIKARRAEYSSQEVTAIPTELLSKYFEQTEQGYVFDQKIRNKIIFGHHNLIEDAPMSKIDLLVCRNALIYFNTETQEKILIRFHFALKDNGFLFLGNSETVTTFRKIFTPVNLKHRVFAKGLNLKLEDHLLITAKIGKKQALDLTTTQVHIWQTAYEASPFAQVAVDANGILIAANEQANILFGLSQENYHRPFREVELCKLVDDHLRLQVLYIDRRPLTLKNIQWSASNGIKYFDITITPIFNQKKYSSGVILTFVDVSDRQQLADKLEYTSSQLKRVSETLEQTKAAANSAIVELEYTQLELEAVHQEIQFIERDIQTKN